MLQLLPLDPPPPPPPISPPAESGIGPEQGVIEEARRRQRRRRIRTAVATLIVAAILGILAWALDGGESHASPVRAGEAGHASVIDASSGRAPGFNVRLFPMLTVGQVGWCEAIEENGRTGGSACGGVPTPSQPLLQVQGSYSAGAPYETVVVVSDPQVAAILANGTLRVPTVPLPGLPYGLRGARIRIPVAAPRRVLPGGRLPLHPQGPTVVALDAQGRPLVQRWGSTPRQAGVRSWQYPSRPSRGVCQLRVGGLPGISARGGEVATGAIGPFPGALVGHAFLPCIATVYYLQHVPLRAVLVLDAAHPGARAAALPNFKPVRAAQGFFAQGGLTAKRSGSAWLIVGQGSGLAQRMTLLRHLTSTVGR
jgi:hypothetical protein